MSNLLTFNFETKEAINQVFPQINAMNLSLEQKESLRAVELVMEEEGPMILIRTKNESERVGWSKTKKILAWRTEMCCNYHYKSGVCGFPDCKFIHSPTTENVALCSEKAFKEIQPNKLFQKRRLRVFEKLSGIKRAEVSF